MCMISNCHKYVKLTSGEFVSYLSFMYFKIILLLILYFVFSTGKRIILKCDKMKHNSMCFMKTKILKNEPLQQY